MPSLAKWLLPLVVFGISAALGLRFFSPQPPEVAIDAERLLYEASEHLASGDRGSAQASLDRLDAEVPNHPGSRALRAYLVRKSNPVRAEELVIELAPTDLTEQGRAWAMEVWLSLDRPGRAREFLGVVRPDEPMSAPLALAYAKLAIQGDRDASVARTALENALRVDTRHVEARQMLAGLLAESPSVVDQIRAKSLVRGLDADGELSLALLGRVLFADGMPFFQEELVSYAERLIQHPDFPDSELAESLTFFRHMSGRFRAFGRWDLVWRMDQARADLPDSTDDDLRDYIDAGLRVGRTDRLVRQLPYLRDRLPAEPRVDLVAAVNAHLEGQDRVAVSHLQRAMAKGEPSAVLLEGLNYLAGARRLGPELGRELAERLLSTEGVAPGDVLLGANTLLRGVETPAAREELATRIEARFADQPELLFPWLRAQGFPRRALAQGERLLAAGETRFASLLVDLAAVSGEVAQAEAVLAAYRDEIDPFVARVLDLRLAEVRGETAAVQAQWDALWEEARAAGDPAQMAALCHLALGLGETARARLAARTVIESGRGLPKEDFVALSNLALRDGDLEQARAFLERAILYYPVDPDLVNDATYFEILAGDADERTLERMTPLVAAHPRRTFYRFTLALAHLVAGSSGEALELIERVNIHAAELPDASRGIYAAVMFANGRGEVGQEILARVDRRRLLPAERTVLSRFWPE
ncbi:MAG: hypothetical protein ACLFU2_05150 [Opitutales bacterium]